MPPEDTSKVDKLDDTLYSRTRYKDPLEARASIISEAPLAPGAKEAWGEGPGLNEILTMDLKPGGATPFMKKFFLFAALFFGATLVVAAFVFLGGNNFISSKNVDLSVVGPGSAPAGEPVELEVTIRNGNNADLELANFSVQYPTGARNPSDSSQALTFTKESLGAIGAGDEVTRTIRFFLIGQEGEEKELKFSVEYKVTGSNATFYKDKAYPISIGTSPLSLTIEAPEKVTSGEPFTTTVSVTQNSTEVLKNVMLRGEYPYGYSVTQAAPAAFSEKNVWALGDLSPGAVKKITIAGVLVGENRDERTLRFYAGAAEGTEPSANFKNILLSAQKTVMLERPSINVAIRFNGESGAVYVAPAGQSINTTISFKNNLPEKLLNPQLSVRFTGLALDEGSIGVFSNGFYNSGTDRASWTILSPEGKAEILPGEEGSVSLRFASYADLPPARTNRDIGLEISLTGIPFGSRTPVTVTETRTVKIASQVTFSSRAARSGGPFQNRGPLPPQVEKETTYTVLWAVGNTQSDLTDAKVTAKLAPAVKWLGGQSSGTEDLSYNPTTNTVTWTIGTLASGAGFVAPLREAAFQIGLTPSLSQVGSVPTLVTNIAFTGFDAVAGKTVMVTNPALTTTLSSDPAFIQGDDIVVK